MCKEMTVILVKGWWTHKKLEKWRAEEERHKGSPTPKSIL
jgi:hypothetical protein